MDGFVRCFWARAVHLTNVCLCLCFWAQIEQDESGVFRSKPYNGLIMPHCVQLVAFRFRPTEAERCEPCSCRSRMEGISLKHLAQNV